MPLTRQQKESIVTQAGQHVTQAVSVAFVSFNGLSLPDMNELRDKLYEQGCSMQVMPKRLLRLVMQQAKLDFDPMAHEGQMAMVWGGDPIAPAKVVYEFAKTHEQLQLRAGVFEKDMLSLEQVIALAKLPSREQLLGQLLSVMTRPARGLVGVLGGVPRAAVYVLSAIAEKRKAQNEKQIS